MDDELPLRGRDIVCISSIDWTFLWQGHQEIMSRFAAAGNHVIFVDNTGVRTIRWSDAGRVVERLIRSLGRRGAFPRAAERDVRIVSPLLLPFPRLRLATLLNERVLIPRLARHVRSLGARDPILFTFLPTPNALRLIELLRTPRSVVVYYCVADFMRLSDLGPLLGTARVLSSARRTSSSSKPRPSPSVFVR